MMYTRILLIVLLSIHTQASAMDFVSKARSWMEKFNHASPEDSDSDSETPQPFEPKNEGFLVSSSVGNSTYKNELWKLCLTCNSRNEERVTQEVAALISTGLYNVNERNDNYKNENLLHITGPRTKLTQLLVNAGAEINAQDLEGNTPLHNACSFGYKAAISILLLCPTINVNIKNKEGNYPIFCALKALNGNFKAITTTHNILNLLIDSKKINLNKKNKLKETFFYRWFSKCSLRQYDELPLNFISQFTEEERQTFGSQELQHAAAICSSEPELYLFIPRCLELGADINHRNYKRQRPLEVAAEQYMYATKCLTDDNKSFQAKQNIYYNFLQNTPYLYDKGIRKRLKHNKLPIDLIKKIMGYYTVLNNTVDRVCVLQSNGDFSSPLFSKKNKRELLNKICNHLGYINPIAKKQLELPQNS